MPARPKIPILITGARPFHDKGLTGDNITIAILDSGIAPHRDLNHFRLLAFHDFVSGHTHPYDDFSHGTHIAGIITSKKTGIAPGANLIVLKILDQYGNSSTETFVYGIHWILEHREDYRIRIVNISVGGDSADLRSPDAPLNRWVSRLWDAGIIVCCSAGNNGPRPDSITAPGICRKVITVGASDGIRFSSAGLPLPYITKPELVAPGQSILSTIPGNSYSPKTGTSMSVPFVSAASALLLQRDPSLTNEEVKKLLMASAIPMPHIPYSVQGAGVLNLRRLLE